MGTAILLDSGSALHTKDILDQGVELVGQTTNPTYFVKVNPDVQDRLERGEKFSKEELLDAYKKLAKDIREQIPEGSISLEVYADENSAADDLVRQGRDFNSWIQGAHIKLPITKAGLEAAHVLVKEGVAVNMTLCFTQAQAAAVHAATVGAQPGQVLVSPFVSRLYKQGIDGLTLLDAVVKMFREAESHVSMLAASVHDVYDIAYIMQMGADMITIPYGDFPAWIQAGKPTVIEGIERNRPGLSVVPYEQLDVTASWETFDISHELTSAGLQSFANDWNSVLK